MQEVDAASGSGTATDDRAMGRLLIKAARTNDWHGAKQAMLEGADPNYVAGAQRSTALHYAAKSGFVEVANLLLDAAANVNAQSASGWTPLHFAVNAGNEDMCRLLRAYGARPDLVNEWLKAPSDIARDKKLFPLVEILKTSPSELTIPRVEPPAEEDEEARNGGGGGDETEDGNVSNSNTEQGLSVPSTPKADESASEATKEEVPRDRAVTQTSMGKSLARAVRANDADKVKQAIAAGAPLDYVNPTTTVTALHVACKAGYVQPAQVLLEAGANVNCQTQTGWTPMHFAVNTGNHELAELLRAFGARVDMVNEWLKAPTDLAKERKDEAMLEILKQKPGPIVEPATGAGGGTAAPAEVVAVAVEKSAEEPKKVSKISHPSREAPALPPKRPSGSRLSLNLDSITVLAKSGAAVAGTESKAAGGKEELQISPSRRSQLASSQTLSPRRAGVGKDLHKRLVRAVRNNDLPAVRAALEAGSDPETPSSGSATRAVHIAAKHGLSDVLTILLEFGADRNPKTKTGWTPLHFAASSGMADAIRVLLEHGANRQLSNESGKKPIDLAVDKKRSNVIPLLKTEEPEAPPDVLSPRDLMEDDGSELAVDDSEKHSLALCQAVRQDDFAEVQRLLDAGVDLDWQSPETGTAADHIAAKHSLVDVCDALLQRGAMVNVQNSSGWTPMHFAANSGFFEMVDLLRSYGALADILNSQQKSAIDIAKQAGFTRIVELLRKKEPRSGVVEEDADSDSHAASPRRQQINQSMADDVSAAPTPAPSSDKVLARAAQAGDPDAVRAAIEAGADVNFPNPTTSIAPLHIACKTGNSQVARVMLEHEADPNIQTKAGWTPMHFAVNGEYHELADLLKSFGARSDVVNEWLKAPMDIARDKQDEEMIRILRKQPFAPMGEADKSPKVSDEPGPAPAAEVVVAEKSSVVVPPIPLANNAGEPGPESPAKTSGKDSAKQTDSGQSSHRSESIISPRLLSPRFLSPRKKKVENTGPLEQDMEQKKLVDEAVTKKAKSGRGFRLHLRKSKPKKNAEVRKSLPDDAAPDHVDGGSASEGGELASPKPFDAQELMMEDAVESASAMDVAKPLSAREATAHGALDEAEEDDSRVVASRDDATATDSADDGKKPAGPPKRYSLVKALSHESVLALNSQKIQRGPCLSPDCDCSGFVMDLEASDAGSMCKTCSHFPSQHQKLTVAAGARKSGNPSPAVHRILAAEGVSSKRSKDMDALADKRKALELEAEMMRDGVKALDPRACKVSGEGIESGTQSKSNVVINVQTISTDGNNWTTAETVSACIRGPTDRKVRVKVFHVGPGQYELSYVRSLGGDYTVAVFVNGEQCGPVPEYIVHVAQIFSSKKSIVKGTALEDGKQSHGLALLSVELHDIYDALFLGDCALLVSISCNDGTCESHVESHMRFQERGIYTVEFVRCLPGKYEVNVTVDEHPIHGSPFRFTIAEQVDPLAKLMRQSPPQERPSDEKQREEAERKAMQEAEVEAAAAELAEKQERERLEREREEEEERRRKEEEDERKRKEQEEKHEEQQRQREEEERKREEEERKRGEQQRQREDEQRQREEEEYQREEEEQRQREEDEQRQREEKEQRQREEEQRKREEEEQRQREEEQRQREEEEQSKREEDQRRKQEEEDAPGVEEQAIEEETLEISFAQWEAPQEEAVSSDTLKAFEEKVAEDSREVEGRVRAADESRLQALGASDALGTSESPNAKRRTIQVGANNIPDTQGTVLKYEDIKGRKKHFMFSDAVDGMHLEAYLDDDEFKQVFEMDKATFYSKPQWKQHALLKKVSLF